MLNRQDRSLASIFKITRKKTFGALLEPPRTLTELVLSILF